jgi:uncharacterized membrane protein YeaQ/YmgE (transglycosylase-associated protein family)
MQTHTFLISGSLRRNLGSLALGVALCLAAGATAQTVTEQVGTAANDAKKSVETAASDAKQAVEDAGRSVSWKLDEIWSRIDERRLKNRTRDEIVAWVIMGVLAGGLAGLFRGVRTSGQQLGDIALGLVGALLAGFIVNVAQLDMGLGPVLIRYEDLLFAMIGAVVLMFGYRFLVSRAKKKV